MKFSFFDQKLPEPLAIYLFSFLDPHTLAKTSQVSKGWNQLAERTKQTNELSPIIQHIPRLRAIAPYRLKLKQLSGGMTNLTYFVKQLKRLSTPAEQFVLRVPGKNTSSFINRQHEGYNARQTSQLAINVSIEFFNDQDGLQLTRFFENSKPLIPALLKEKQVLEKVAGIFQSLHQSHRFSNDIHLFQRNEALLKAVKDKAELPLPKDLAAVEDGLAKIAAVCGKYKIPLKPCHNDPTPGNFLMSLTSYKLIDWEYSGNNDFLWDLVYFCMEGKLSAEQEKQLLGFYFDKVTPTIEAWFEVYKPLVSWWITLWCWTQLTNKANATATEAYVKLAETSYEATQASLKNPVCLESLALIASDTEKTAFDGLRPF
ncbi:choline kinase [Legionella taurinensis]|uniref:Choline kinase n=1 Tax=Legionella taurinensis TaxID=70611 RepID=A0A3A5L573_9GAMM|nr:phosphotransferase family protein [Legionella taurinensis]MDX1837377.1 phosphotransferase family protein [Legionella taurinensis]PUT40730.1 choline kinase [Legionella taurinensis]PUT44152.1 choline kinase [Legionella taurinensis]PUT47453.1 choline kinase [Legionella taurinensis]PUT48592.1 choline kinase [Legionella taurinensis]